MYTAAPGSTSWNWNTNVAAGTSFILGAFDGGKTGIGGCGCPYTDYNGRHTSYWLANRDGLGTGRRKDGHGYSYGYARGQWKRVSTFIVAVTASC